MNKLLILLFLSISSLAIHAQTSLIDAEKIMYSEQLNLDEAQKLKLDEILLIKASDLQLINERRNEDEMVFRAKRRNIYNGTVNSIRLMLKEDQLSLWKDLRIAQRKQNAELAKKLKASGAGKEDLLDAQYGILN